MSVDRELDSPDIRTHHEKKYLTHTHTHGHTKKKMSLENEDATSTTIKLRISKKVFFTVKNKTKIIAQRRMKNE